MDQAAEDDFRAFVTARSAKLLRTAYLLAGNRGDAEDLLATALARTYLRIGRIRDRGALDAYVRRVLVTTQTSIWRRRRLLWEDPVAQLPERPYTDPGTAELRDALWRALGRLGPRQRAVLVLRYFEDQSEAEIAAALGVTPGTVKSQAARGLAALRRDAGLADDDPLSQLERSP